MEDLNLPPIARPPLPSRNLGMDEFLAFVEFSQKHLLDREAYKKEKRMAAVNIPFRL